MFTSIKSATNTSVPGNCLSSATTAMKSEKKTAKIPSFCQRTIFFAVSSCRARRRDLLPSLDEWAHKKSFNCDNLGVVNKHTIGSVCKQCGSTWCVSLLTTPLFCETKTNHYTTKQAAKRRPNAHPTFVHHHTMAKLGGPREMVSLMAWRLLTPAPTPSHPPTLPPRPTPFTTRTHTHLRGEFKISTKISSFFLLLLLLWLLHRLWNATTTAHAKADRLSRSLGHACTHTQMTTTTSEERKGEGSILEGRFDNCFFLFSNIVVIFC